MKRLMTEDERLVRLPPHSSVGEVVINFVGAVGLVILIAGLLAWVG